MKLDEFGSMGKYVDHVAERCKAGRSFCVDVSVRCIGDRSGSRENMGLATFKDDKGIFMNYPIGSYEGDEEFKSRALSVALVDLYKEIGSRDILDAFCPREGRKNGTDSETVYFGKQPMSSGRTQRIDDLVVNNILSTSSNLSTQGTTRGSSGSAPEQMTFL